MKIVLCHKDLKGGTIWGGIGSLYYNLMKELNKLGVEVITISSWTTRPDKKNKHYYIPYINSVDYREKIFHLLNRIDFDIVECSSWKVELLEYVKQKNHKPIVVRGDLSAFCFGDKSEAELEKELLKRADYRLAVSKSCALDLERNFNIKIDKFILNGVDSNIYKPQHRSDLKHKNLSQTVIWVGKPTFTKGFDILMDLIKLAPEDLSFNIVFGNASQNYPIKLIRKDNVRYYQNLSQKEMIGLYNKSNVSLSTSRYESFGLASLEAMACGIPVVIPRNVPCFKEYIREGIDGFIYNNPNQVIGNIYKAMELNPKQIREQACRFSWTKMARGTLKTYKLLLSK